jgi:hypothetical protein
MENFTILEKAAGGNITRFAFGRVVSRKELA